jgi:phenylalanyl-tRNA synthetase alpha chain
MKYTHQAVAKVAKQLLSELKLKSNVNVLKSPKLKELYNQIPKLPQNKRASYGSEVNALRTELLEIIESKSTSEKFDVSDIDITAPFAVNSDPHQRPSLLPREQGSQHPISQELEKINDIFVRMGFKVADSRQLDNDYNMFSALNFPENHPARDDYDTFMTDEGLIPPAHTSTMQNRILSSSEIPIRYVIPGRTYRNEDVDATHEHTFNQIEGVYVDKDITLADMLGTIQLFLEAYFGEAIEFKTQPFYFPFVEPGLEFLIKMPKSLRKSTNSDEWLEIMGCGMIHPNVLKEAGVNHKKYSGFAWGFGLDRLVMLKNGIEDVRHFHSGNLEFLRSFR